MKKCELCKVPARTFCESDQASLCWDCDAKVHGANFLVARHTRTLLCHACHSLTPWKASGATLGNTVSMCQGCAARTRVHAEEESEGDNDDDIDTEDDDVDDEDQDGDNQVVPWSSTAPPPPSPCSSSNEGSVSRCNHRDEAVSDSASTISLKRRRRDHDFQEGPKRRYGEEWREEVGWLACDGEPPASAIDRFNGPHGGCNDRPSEDV